MTAANGNTGSAIRGAIVCHAPARVGVLGNPSDQFKGCCISAAISNFGATVTLVPNEDGGPAITLVPHPVHDTNGFSDLQQMATSCKAQGYSGGLRLLQATCSVFWQYCGQRGIPLSGDSGAPQGFSLSYDTTIPRQVGLSGSSAIVCAAMKCLMQHYGVTHLIPLEERPRLVLAAEQELGIQAGLQDRVAQVYGGLTFMDFSGPGNGALVTRLQPSLLPPMHLIWSERPKESGKVHSTVKQRWVAGDPAVVNGMQQVAECARQGRVALEEWDVAALGKWMDTNFDLRRSMYTDAALGFHNVRMVEVARSVGAAAKFCGSGGAVLALCSRGKQQVDALLAACEREGLCCARVYVAPETS